MEAKISKTSNTQTKTMKLGLEFKQKEKNAFKILDNSSYRRDFLQVELAPQLLMQKMMGQNQMRKEKNQKIIRQSQVQKNQLITLDLLYFINQNLFWEEQRFTFDTRLITSVPHLQKYNILTENQIVTPEIVGYQMRTLKLRLNHIRKLEFINPHDANHKLEDIINLRKTKLVIPKSSLDAISELRKSLNPVLNVQDKYFPDKDKSLFSPFHQAASFQSSSGVTENTCQSFSAMKAYQTKKENTFISEEQGTYEQKCGQVLYFSLSLVYEKKECDILVQNAGGHFNFVMVKEALQALINVSRYNVIKEQIEYENNIKINNDENEEKVIKTLK